MKKQILFAITCMLFLTVLLWMCGTTVKDGKETKPVDKPTVNEPTSGNDNGGGWRLHEGEIIITSYTGNYSDLVIPDFVRGYPVTQIENGAFSRGPDSRNKINSIIIPESVTIIGDYAFSGNNLVSITLPPSLTHIGMGAFDGNPLNELIIKSDNLLSLPRYVFHPDIPSYLPPGVYKRQDKQWFFQNSDGTLLPILSYFDKLVSDNPGVLSELLYDAVNRLDGEQLKFCISKGADVNSRMLNGQGNTPLASVLGNPLWTSRPSNYSNDSYQIYVEFNLYNTNRKRAAETASILLEAGAVPQHWMLYYSYYQPDIVKTLLERGALTNTESPEYGDPPAFYQRPESLLFHYCQNMATQNYYATQFSTYIAKSAALLLEYGEDANYRDTLGQTPLDLVRMHGDIMEIAGALYKYASRPLPHEEYIRLVGFNLKEVYNVWDEWWGRRWISHLDRDINRDDIYGFDAIVLEDIRRGFLNPELKDEHGKDIFDYAAATGTAKLMEGLLPYLRKSGRTVLAVNRDGTPRGLYIDAVNAENLPTATVLSTVMNKRFTATGTGGNTYSLEYYSYDYQPIYNSAPHIAGGDLLYGTGPEMLRSGPSGNRVIGYYHITAINDTIHYIPNKCFITTNHYIGPESLLLHTLNGNIIDLGTAFIERGREVFQSSYFSLNNYNSCLFGDTFYVSVGYHSNRGHASVYEKALIDISGGSPSVYILDDIDTNLIKSAWDFVINSGKAYLFTNTGEAVVFNVDSHTLRYERTVPFREIRIPGWKGGEWFFVSDEIVTAYNVSTGTVRTMGREVEKKEYYRRYYFYEDANGRRFVVEKKSGKTYPVMTDTEYGWFDFFDRGYMYRKKDNRHLNICFFENGALKRKIVLSGSAVDGTGPLVYGNTMYVGKRHLAFTVDLTSMRVVKAFSEDIIFDNSGYYIYMFPFGSDDIVYAEAYSDGDR